MPRPAAAAPSEEHVPLRQKTPTAAPRVSKLFIISYIYIGYPSTKSDVHATVSVARNVTIDRHMFQVRIQ